MVSEIIKRFNVVFDYNRASIYLKPLSTIKAAFEHDMAGMEIGSAGENYERLIITRVEPKSAAEQAGLMKGDEILAISLSWLLKCRFQKSIRCSGRETVAILS